MLVGTERRLSSSNWRRTKKIFAVTHVCGMNVTIESKRVKKDQVTQCHRCQLYDHGQWNCHAAAVSVKCAGPHQSAECTKSRDVPAKCALCSDPHSASYRRCTKCPYVNHREDPARTQRPVAPKPAPKRPAIRKRQPQPQKVAFTPMETDVPRPSTSSAKPSYAAAIKNIAAKPVARKPKMPGKSSKIPAAVSRPKPASKKPETPKQDSNHQKTRPRRPQDEDRQDGTRRHEHASPADPAIPENQLDEGARSGNHTSTTTPGVQIRSRGWIGASQPPARHPGDIH
ncbi:hypothetical protein Trydic_g2947 [Trypoxylus dichotomus]